MLRHNSRGSLVMGIMIAILIIGSIVMGFVVGLVTDPSRHADIRASASDYQDTLRRKITATCTNSIRWYTITVFCRE